MMKKIVLLLLLTFSFSLNAKIIEIKNIRELSSHIKGKDLVVFDLDNTIIETAQQLGSDQWFCDSMGNYINQGFTKKQAFEKVYRKWLGIQYITEVRLVENDTDTVIKNLQKQNIKLLGLTTRGPEMIFATFKQLEDVDLDFSECSIFSNEFFLPNLSKAYCENGFLFANGHNKGKVLISFFEKIIFFPKSILFIDDKESHLKEVETYCEQHNIDFLGLRYSYLDEKINNFDKAISDVQLNDFYTILSDNEAKNLKK